MKHLMHVANKYSELGLCVIATDALKHSVGEWTDFQKVKPDSSELEWMFLHPSAHSMAVITGSISGNLEVIDIDSKYDLDGELMHWLMRELTDYDSDLVDKLVIAQTRSGGYHLYYRCEEIGRNQPLARRPVTEEEKARHPKQKVKVLIETRAEGGYVIVPPSAGYRFIQHDFSRIPRITPDQRNLVLRIARAFNRFIEVPVLKRAAKPRPPGQLSPLDDYNQRGDVTALLQKHGWTVVRENNKRTWFKRPGDSDSRSSGDFNHEMGLFSVFSTSTEFEPGRGYLPYAVYAMLECNGDFKEAVKRLAKEGYGQASRPQAISIKKKVCSPLN